MRVLIFGGRNFNDEIAMQHALNDFIMLHGPITLVIHGDAPGADRMGARLARTYLGCLIKPFPAAWDDVTAPGAIIRYRAGGVPYNAAAGGWRNKQMFCEGKPDWAIGFPGGPGTRDMLARLDAAGVPVFDAGCRK